MQTSVECGASHSRIRQSAIQRKTAARRGKLEWMAWPLIYWKGSSAVPELPGKRFRIRSLYFRLVDKLRSLHPGIYAVKPGSNEIRLLDISTLRLGAAARALAVGQRDNRNAASIGSMRSRLAQIGECLRMLTADEAKARVQLHDLCWIVDTKTVLPPREIEAILQKQDRLGEGSARFAAMEFLFRVQHGDFGEFVEALQELYTECRLVDNEPARRREALCLLFDKVRGKTPALLPVDYVSTVGERRRTWRFNPDFISGVLETFVLDFMWCDEECLACAAWDTRNAFDRLCEWFAAPAFDAFRPDTAEEVAAPDLRHFIENVPCVETAAWKDHIGVLAGVCAALAGNSGVVKGLSAWLRTCRKHYRQAAYPGKLWEFVTEGLDRWIWKLDNRPDRLRFLAESLTERGAEIFNYGWRGHTSPPEELWSIGLLADFPREEAWTAIDRDLLGLIREHAGKRLALRCLLRFVTQFGRHIGTIAELHFRAWSRFLSWVTDDDLLVQLFGWFENLRSRSFTFSDITLFGAGVTSFIRAEAQPERQRRRQCFLSRQFDFLERLLREVEFLLSQAALENGSQSHSELFRFRLSILELSYQWEIHGGDAEQLFERLCVGARSEDLKALAGGATRLPDQFWSISGIESVVVGLSAQDQETLFRLLDAYVEEWSMPDHPHVGWNFLNGFPEVQKTLQLVCRRNSGRLYLVLRILGRLALALRLQQSGFLNRQFGEWNSAASLGESIEGVRALSRLAGFAIPRPIEHASNLQDRLRSEYTALCGKLATGDISASALRRLDKLSRLLREPERLDRWRNQELARLIGKVLPEIGARAAGSIARQAVRKHWKEVLWQKTAPVGADWDNALHLYYTLSDNKELLQKLLRGVGSPGPDWRLRHPPNQRFLVALCGNGVRAEAWLAGYRRQYLVHGHVWTLYTEQNPLRILQMGNLFDTCLSVNGCNAFAAVANAVELNKRVLFVRDHRGVIIGRRLIGLTSEGGLVGFRSYGAAGLQNRASLQSPRFWIKILFDLACLELAHSANGRLVDEEQAEAAARELEIDARWYNDGPEPFDWWIVESGNQAYILARLAQLQNLEHEPLSADEDEFIGRVAAKIRLDGMDQDAQSGPAIATLRALALLGDKAFAALDSAGSPAADGYRSFLRSRGLAMSLRACPPHL